MSQVIAELERLAQHPAESRAEASVRLLAAQLSPEHEQCLRLSAIPHHFNPPILIALEPSLRHSEAVAVCAEFLSLGLSVEIPEGFKLHDEVRRLFFGEWLRQADASDFRARHRRLVEFFSAAQPDPCEAAAFQRQVIFHAVGADQEAGIAVFEQAVRDLRHQFRLGDCGALIALVHEYDPILAPVQALRLAYQDGKLAADLRRWPDAERQFVSVVGSAAVPDELRVKALLRLGMVYRNQRQWQTAIETYERAVDVARRTLGTMDDARCIHALATVYRDADNLDKAKTLLLESIHLAEQNHDPICIAQGYNALGLVHLRAHDAGEALSAFQASLRHLEVEQVESAQLFHNLGSAYQELPDLARSRQYFERSLELKRREGDIGGQAMTLNNLARVHEAEGRRADAIAAAEEAARLFEQVHDYYNAGQASRNLARLHLRAAAGNASFRRPGVLVLQGSPEGAVAFQAFQRAMALFRSAGAPDAAASVEREIREFARGRTIPWWAWVIVALAGGVLVLAVIGLAASMP